MKRRGIVLQNHFAFPRGAERLVVLIAKGLGSLRVTWSSRTRSGQTFKAPVRPGTLGPYLLFPKALVDVAGKPFVVRQLEYLRRQGVVRVVLCLGHLDEQVVEIVADRAVLDLDVRYSWNGPYPQTTFQS